MDKLEREDDIKDWNEIVNFYIWGCWNCINSVIATTQSKEAVFEKYLFTSDPDQSPIWNLIVPPTITYEFSVETNFKVKSLDNEENLETSPEDEIIKRFNDNFFANDNLLMSTPLEAQLDQPRADRRRHDKVKQLVDNEEQEMEIDEEPEQSVDDDDFELDDVNRHPCMQTILKVIDTLNEKFSGEWSKGIMPGWMQKLHTDLVVTDTTDKNALNASAKLFILKLLVNRPHVFQTYAEFWLEPLTDYITSKNTGGRGLHYFLRDICMMLINFLDNIDLTKEENASRLSNVLNCLIKYAADKSKLVFGWNINIIGKLMEKCKGVVTEINEGMLNKMLNSKEGEVQNSDLWRMAGIQIIALSCKVGMK